MMFILRNKIITSLCHTITIGNFNFFRISSLISWANPFKNHEFRQKSENFHCHSNFFMTFILRNNNHYLSFSYDNNQKIYLFEISSLISWANTFKNREFRQKFEY